MPINRTNMETAASHNALLTGSTEDLVSENDYRRKIASLMQTIELLEGFTVQQRKEIDIVHERCLELEKRLWDIEKLGKEA